jgi:hypothetical protein
MRFPGFKPCRSNLSLAIAAVLIVSISQLHAAEAVSGKDGERGKGSFLSARVNGVLFEYDIVADETAAESRDGLVALIDADPDFMAVAKSKAPPGVFEVDDIVYEVLTESGVELNSMTVCENDENYSVSGVFFPNGKSQARLLKPDAVAGGGIYDLRFDVYPGSDVALSIPTVPGGVAILINAITTGLTDLGFEVTDLGSELEISRPRVYFVSGRVETKDASITHTCVGLSGPSLPSAPPGATSIPTLSQYALVLLAVALLLVGLSMIRKKRVSRSL